MASPSHVAFGPSRPRRRRVWHLHESAELSDPVPESALFPSFWILLTRHRYSEALYVLCAAAVTDDSTGAVARWFDSRTELGCVSYRIRSRDS